MSTHISISVNFKHEISFDLEVPAEELKLLSFQYEKEAGLVLILGKDELPGDPDLVQSTEPAPTPIIPEFDIPTPVTDEAL